MLSLGLIENNQINPRRLLLLEKDRALVRVTIPETGDECTVPHPGKSALICPVTEECEAELVRSVAAQQLASTFDRRDHIHVSTVGKVKRAGWIPIYAPLQLEQKILHARLVSQRTLDDGSDPTLEDA